MADFVEIGKRIGELVEQKNRAYGDSFRKCGEFLKLLYPNGNHEKSVKPYWAKNKTVKRKIGRHRFYR